jgi:hypothetical protein
MRIVRIAKPLAVLVLSALCCFGTGAGAAETKSSTNATVTPKLPPGMPVYGKVGAIDKQAGAITLQGKEKVRTFYITSQTKVHRDGKPAKLEEVVIGQWIGGYARPDANGRSTLSTLNLEVVQRTPAGGPTNSPAKPRAR